MTIVMNTPTCKPCAGSTPANAGIPPFYAVDAGRLTLVADTPQTLTFTNIRATAAADWVMPKADCLHSDGHGVAFDITSKTATGFTVVAYEDSTFEYFCIKV